MDSSITHDLLRSVLVPWTGISISFFLAPFIAVFVLRTELKDRFWFFLLRLLLFCSAVAGIFLVGVYWSHQFQINASIFLETVFEFLSILSLSYLVGILLLRYVQGYSYRLIASFVGLSIGISVSCVVIIFVSWLLLLHVPLYEFLIFIF